ncbi:long-chain fatty acid--CoA ligase [Sphingomonas sp. CGMCC 1.13654]|uniref:Long-chain fatty acid--CoA ligase n=1 Tax=Sphingomonas chungangi TaxID=2683589 RepID=A0A838L7J1_9SPHN|nr:AMP-dependent synthetase/ligase [Sphingomonas chungangi]MBA2935453.1 long-chain fatty acid--CoA ligase [Sphingomonas chungangi]MVW56960.1 AMP-binding protein [Sphingomonas chungangi]
MRLLEHFPNLVTMFFARAAEKGDAPMLWRKEAGAWVSTSWREAARQVAALAGALKEKGLQPGDRVLLVSENRPEWCIADYAIMAAGCVTVPAYTSNTTRDHAHVLENSGAKAVVVSTAKLAATLIPAVLRSGHVTLVVGMEAMKIGQQGTFEFCNWDALAAAPSDIGACADAAKAFGRDDLACIIYTSGTGGAPRGVMQHHGAILHNVAGASHVVSEDFGWGDEVFLSFLPLSHAYEHTGGQHLPVGLGGQIYYAEGLDKLAANIEEVRPTLMVVVPRLFEVLRTRIAKAIEKQGALPAWLLQRAEEMPDRPKLWQRPMDMLLSATIRKKVRGRFGGRMKALVSGGAPLNPEVGRFFASLGLMLLQGYGQTEAAPVISCNRPKAGIKLDTVGPPLPDTEIRIAEDGEIQVKGELVMKGYWQNPEETARVLSPDGWLATGDIGHIDDRGRLVITDRKKDIIVNDKGDNVAPQRVEGMLTLQPEILQAMVSGDRRPYLVGLVVPDPEWQAEWAKMAPDAGPDALHRALQAAVDRVNADLSTTEKVRRVLVADEAFTIENTELTPSMKIRRHVIRARYGARLDALYKASAY